MIINTLEKFCTYFNQAEPIIAIDYGQRKIGVAISIPGHMMSLPLCLIEERLEKKQLQQIKNIIEQKNIAAIIFGLPLNMNGTKNQQTIIVKEFASKLAKQTKLPIFLQDERLTSKAADNFLKNFGLKRKERNQLDDLTAASMILETVLDNIKLLK